MPRTVVPTGQGIRTVGSARAVHAARAQGRKALGHLRGEGRQQAVVLSPAEHEGPGQGGGTLGPLVVFDDGQQQTGHGQQGRGKRIHGGLVQVNLHAGCAGDPARILDEPIGNVQHGVRVRIARRLAQGHRADRAHLRINGAFAGLEHFGSFGAIQGSDEVQKPLGQGNFGERIVGQPAVRDALQQHHGGAGQRVEEQPQPGVGPAGTPGQRERVTRLRAGAQHGPVGATQGGDGYRNLAGGTHVAPGDCAVFCSAGAHAVHESPGEVLDPAVGGFTRQAQGCEEAHGPRAHGGDVGQVLRGRFAADLVPAATGSVEAPEPGVHKVLVLHEGIGGDHGPLGRGGQHGAVVSGSHLERFGAPRCAECIGHSFVMRLDNGHEGAQNAGLSQLRERRLARGMVPRFTRCLRIHTLNYRVFCATR